MSPGLRCRQRGAIGLMAAGTLAVALVFMLLAVDSGRLYLEKRKLQSIADTAALEAANRGGQCSPATTANDYAKENAARNGFTVVAGDTSRGLAVTCGTLATNAGNIRVYTVSATQSDAVRVVATRSVITSIASGIWGMFGGAPVATQTVLSATAVAAYAPPVAQLSIRSSLGTIDSTKSDLLNMLIGRLLGGTLTLNAASWKGLTDTNINLLSYLDQLALKLNVTAGDYQALLKTAVSANDLIDAAVKVLQQGGSAVSAVINDTIKVQAIAAGSSKSAVSLATQVNIPLVGTVSIQTKVIEPPQLSAIGNPAKAKAGLLYNPPTDQISVRTAQVRTLLTVQAPVLNVVSSVATALNGLGKPVSTLLSGLLNLNIPDAVGGLLCLVSCEITDVVFSDTFTIYLEAGSAEAHVTDYACATPATKSLTVQSTTSVARLGIGSIDATSAFSSSAPVNVQPLRLIDFGKRSCAVLNLLCSPNRTPNVGGGLTLRAQSTVGAQTSTLLFSPVAEMNTTPTYKSPPGTVDIVASLSGTLSGLEVNYVPPTGSVSSGALAGVAGTLSTIVNSVIGLVQGVLSPLLDPIINTLLKSLGISLGNAEVGANLSCHLGRAYLVI
ncbi:hypothetical protein AO262_37245 [Pseudomonas fluorescens ABAC62]|nr:hypothetical protein AO262_37245 [Pseudomonas fluorescens ABAC62]